MPDSPDTPAFQPLQSQPVTPPTPPYGVPPPKSGSSALKVVLIVIGAIVAVLVLGFFVLVFTIVHFAKHNIHKGANGEVTINTPGGAITASSSEKFTESDLGIAIYPGAQQGKDSVKMKIGNMTTITAEFFTPDPKDKVIDFYKEHAGSSGQVTVNDSAGNIVLVSNGQSTTINITDSPDPGKGKTKITIVRAPNTGASY
ncbi:MAG: hypothetical protein ACLQHF_07120 [Terracidiphilus sp.]